MESFLTALNKYEMAGNIDDKKDMTDTKCNYDLKLRRLRQDSTSDFIKQSEN